jgi:16S rRNA (adenine1518-N6/adenine1519-N6)-dimethyltransferase
MKLSEMKQILSSGAIRLTKSLGQNFLHDGNQLRRIVAVANLKPADKVLEIGPGLGPLTERLLAEAGEVFAIEKDARLANFLRERFKAAPTPRPPRSSKSPDSDKTPGLLLVHADALEYLRREPRDWSDWKLVANLPYSVASPILVELAQAKGCPERMVVTLQRDVARRLIAQPGNKDYGLLTLLVQLRYDPRNSFKIPASCFFPEPDVDSTCITLLRRPEPLLSKEQAATFVKIVKRAFSQRRKMMFKLLKEDWPEERLAVEFERSNLSLHTRAEAVTLEQFVHLTRIC